MGLFSPQCGSPLHQTLTLLGITLSCLPIVLHLYPTFTHSLVNNMNNSFKLSSFLFLSTFISRGWTSIFSLNSLFLHFFILLFYQAPTQEPHTSPTFALEQSAHQNHLEQLPLPPLMYLPPTPLIIKSDVLGQPTFS